ncbi:hypothetical protein MUK51_07570 [Sphingobacterium faecium]|jgi:hypothetical protein|uniref:hypothetical protein n=1 Tax=Sphingobacterium faecium TaxID=34087 RepID=UPI0021B6B72C|nr:hypothetical protein [Sphingobacterium faecium]UXD71142.1 hypothetical protein MUK51_07570 [Sphingobacterium faecium]
MNRFNGIHTKITQKGADLAKQKIEADYSEKFVYALPDWAMLTGNPEIIGVVQIYGNEGILVTQQRVDFEVDFGDEHSIIYYTNYLNNQMNAHLPLLGYVLFYKNVLIVQKDPNYPLTLSDLESEEIIRYNSNNISTDFSFIIFNKELELVASTADLRE